MTSDLRAALTHALQPLLPPEHVAGAVQAAVYSTDVAVDELNPRSRADRVPSQAATVGEWAVHAALASLPSPYREAAEIAEAIAPLVQAWWRDRVVEVEAGSVTVTEHRT